METCMLLAGMEYQWALVTPVKAIRVGVGFYKKNCKYPNEVKVDLVTAQVSNNCVRYFFLGGGPMSDWNLSQIFLDIFYLQKWWIKK